MAGLLPPSSSVTDVRCFAAAAMTRRPTSGLPVKKTWSNGCVQQRRGHRRVSFEDGHVGRVERLFDQPAGERRTTWRHFRRLDDGRIASGDGRHERAERQIEGVVPRHDDERDASGFVADLCGGSEHRQRGRNPVRPHPSLEVPDGMPGLSDDGQHLREIHFGPRLAEIGGRRRADLLPVRLDRGRRAF